MGHVAFLAHDRMRGRGGGTPEEALAAAYVAAELQKLGLEAVEQPFEIPNTAAEGGVLESRNVLAWLPGSDPALGEEHILIGAHLDHLGVRNGTVFNGADDNASGVAGLLGIARALASGPAPRRSILFVAFGSEELGLRGSRHYVAHPAHPLEDLVAMINFDMIGHGNFLDGEAMKQIRVAAGLEPGPGVGLLGGGHAPVLLELARDAFDYEEIPLYAPEDYPRAIREMVADMTAGRSDHAPFEQARIPYLFFSTSEHDRYHESTDDPDTLDGEVLRAVARAAYRTVLAIDALEERPEFVDGY
jgi:Zn-dependent M28 family amino/carboxypeptidase